MHAGSCRHAGSCPKLRPGPHPAPSAAPQWLIPALPIPFHRTGLGLRDIFCSAVPVFARKQLRQCSST